MAQFKGTINQEVINMCNHVISLLNNCELHADQVSTILGNASLVKFENHEFKGIDAINSFLSEYYKLGIKDFTITSDGEEKKNINITSDGERSFICILQCQSSSEVYTNMIITIFLSNGSNKVGRKKNRANKITTKAIIAGKELQEMAAGSCYELENAMEALQLKQIEVKKLEEQAIYAESKIEEAKAKAISSFWVRKIIFMKLI